MHFTLHMSNTSFEEEFQLKGKKKMRIRKDEKKKDKIKLKWPGLKPLNFRLERRRYIHRARYAGPTKQRNFV